ncbi:MAG: hypothetical protein AMJ78_09375 [Omnitrophica WOR_2 bacterium SM23_29]|nr:MAG: hypothetical protein AMJ78_09375 [Omnitrophica WOR_2 bacterium SM23_29]
MIEINLLPQELRKKKKQPLKLPRLPALPIVAGIIGCLIFIQVLLLIMVQAKKASFNSLNKKLTSISTLNAEAKGVEDKLKEFSSKVDAVNKLSTSRFNWGEKLNDLSDSVVSGIWLRRIYVKSAEPKRLLILEGSSIVSGAEEPGSIGKFVNSLKENSSFSEDFDEIELTKVERRKIGRTEVIDFIIACHFKPRRNL